MNTQDKKLRGYFGREELDSLGVAYGTDKSSLCHDYLRCYEFFMSPYRGEPFTFMEIGIYEGASLKMWRDYFHAADIVGVDIHSGCKAFEETRIKIAIGDASDPSFLANLQTIYRPLIILDDASHLWTHQITAFETLFPRLPNGGIYICEDIHTSFEPLASEGYKDSSVDAFTYFSTLSYLVAGSGNLSQVLTNNAVTPFQKNIFRSISSITIKKHTVIITK